MSDYDEGYRAGMQIVRDLAHKRIEDLEAKLEKAMQVIEAYEEDEGYVPRRVVSLYEELKGQNYGWKCPINYPNCKENCGNYGCGN